MELVDLEMGLHKYLCSQGLTLNIHELTGLHAGSGTLQHQEKYSNLYFWGKISCVKGAYYIVYGLRNDGINEFPSKNFYYCTDDFVFNELPEVIDEEDLAIIHNERNTVFSGNPDLDIAPQPEDGEEPPEDPKQVFELQRLSITIQNIDHDCAVVPKGSFTLNENQQVVPAHDFDGLTQAQALKLDQYVHLRPPVSLDKLRIMVRDDIEWKMSGFLDSLDSDVPKGCWAMRDEGCGHSINLRSLQWPGYVSYHIPRSKYFGSVYIGMGLKNHDLTFML